MKYGVLYFILLLTVSTVTAQPMSTVIKTQAVAMGRALVNNDVNELKKYMHPELMKAAGGEEKLSLLADSALIMFRNMGGSVSKIFFGNPTEIVNYKNELQTTLPQTIYLTTSFADIEYQSMLIATSPDKGQHWYFIDTSVYKESELRKKLPDISPEIVIPPVQKPKILPKAKSNG